MKSLPITYALFSGTIGTQSVLFCKTLSTLLRTTFAGDSQLQSYFFWLTFLSFVATAYFWISRLNMVSPCHVEGSPSCPSCHICSIRCCLPGQVGSEKHIC